MFFDDIFGESPAGVRKTVSLVLAPTFVLEKIYTVSKFLTLLQSNWSVLVYPSSFSFSPSFATYVSGVILF